VNNGELVLAFDAGALLTFVTGNRADALTNTATGVIRRTGSGTARYGGGLVNDGLIRVQNGTLDLRGVNATGTTGAGTIEVEPGATLRVTGANHTQASVTGAAVAVDAGRLTITDTYSTDEATLTGGRLEVDADGDVGTLTLMGGVLEGGGTITVTSALDWSGGQMDGSGMTVLGPSVPLTIGAANVNLNGTRTLRTEGPVTWTGDVDLGGSGNATFENAGSLTSSGPGERRASPTFRNAGTLVHDGGTLRFNGPADNEGLVQILDGTIRMSGLNGTGGTDTGRHEIGASGRLEYVFSTWTVAEGAEVVGTGTVAFVDGTVVNQATWRPGASPGIVTIDSDWPAPEPEAVLDVEIGGPTPGTDFDQFSVTGRATLGGTLRVTLLDGFEPAEGDRFRIVAAGSGATGAFDALDLPDGLEAFVETSAAGAELVIGMPVANEDDGPGRPDAFALHAPAPNPAAGPATLRYDVPEAGTVRLGLYDALGREVAVLVDGEQPAGTHAAVLDGRGLAAGLYFVRLTADGVAETRRVTLLR
ncbi:MAG: T9SS type A sorting domain-containing protein, partial [Rubricoccaceae bacterium]|nr:T9SS type A sorting domain-containing protein [Rubricoccaceae bacterium]